MIHYPVIVGKIDLKNPQWAKSLPVGLLKEAELVFHHQIVEGVEVNEIPDSLVPNLDQASSKYVLVSTTTLAKCKCQSKSQMTEDP